MTRHTLPCAVVAGIALAAAGLLLLPLACVDWEQLTAPPADAGTLADAGAPVDGGPDGCGDPPPDAPALPAARCGSVQPLEGEDWQRVPFPVADGTEPLLGARVDQLIVAQGAELRFFCGAEEAADSPVTCPSGPLLSSDVAPDGSLVMGTTAGACVIRDGTCVCAHLDEPGALGAVAVVTAETFALLVQFGDDDGAPAPVLKERRLDDPEAVVGAVSLVDAPTSNDLPMLTRLARPCADPATFAAAVHFATSNRLFTAERRSPAGGLTVVELPALAQDEAVGVVAAPVGTAPGTPVQLLSARVTPALDLEAQRGGLLSGSLERGLFLRGDAAGYDDFLTGSCATRGDGRYACTGSRGLLVTDVHDDAARPVALPRSVPRHGDATGAASLGDDAWVFGNDFVARTSLSVPAAPVALRTDVVANLGAGERVVGAPLADRRILLGSPLRSAVIHMPDSGPPTVSAVPLSIDALALGAGGFPGAGVVAWAERGRMTVSAAAVNDNGDLLGAAIQAPTALVPEFATVDHDAASGTVSLWLGGLEDYGSTTAMRLNLQVCRAVASSGTPALACTAPPATVDVEVRGTPSAGAMVIEGDWLFFAGSGGVALVELTPTRDGVGAVHTQTVPVVNGLDPFALGVTAIARSLDCLYVGAGGRVVQPFALAIGTATPVTALPPLSRQLEPRALLTLFDDSVLVGAEHGRLGRFVKDPSDTTCINEAPAEPFAVAFGPLRPTGRMIWRPVFAGDALYVADEDRGVWRVPLP